MDIVRRLFRHRSQTEHGLLVWGQYLSSLRDLSLRNACKDVDTMLAGSGRFRWGLTLSNLCPKTHKAGISNGISFLLPQTPPGSLRTLMMEVVL